MLARIGRPALSAVSLVANARRWWRRLSGGAGANGEEVMAPIPVLVVEDNEANQRLVRYLLGSRGYEPHIASTAGEALQMLKTLRPRLVLMDLQLPGMNGYELTRLLRADPATRGLKIV